MKKNVATIALAIACFISGYACSAIEWPVESYVEPYAVPATILECNEVFIRADVHGHEFVYYQEDDADPFILESGDFATLHIADGTVVGVN